MSKLKQFLIFGIVLGCCAAIFPAKKIWLHSQREKQRQLKNSELAWGKARAPILARIIEQVDGDIITLEGQISTQFNVVAFEWRLPDGVQMIDGDIQNQMTKTSNDKVLKTFIKIKKPSSIAFPHILFRAFDPNTEIGTNAVYNLAPSPQEKEIVETVKEHFQSRGNTYVK